MEIPRFLAMTGAEFAFCKEKPAHIAWMACHFSPYGTGLSNLPEDLPAGSMLILNDRIPICGHDADRIAHELCDTVSSLECDGILLDLQRSGCPENRNVAEAVLSFAHVPVGVSHLYAEGLDCPVFLPPPDLDVPLRNHLAPWDGREIWLEAALDTARFKVTEKGCTSLPYALPMGQPFRDESLCCTYTYTIADTAAIFSLWRTPEDLTALLEQAGEMGVTRAIGLYQQLKEGPLA